MGNKWVISWKTCNNNLPTFAVIFHQLSEFTCQNVGWSSWSQLFLNECPVKCIDVNPRKLIPAKIFPEKKIRNREN